MIRKITEKKICLDVLRTHEWENCLRSSRYILSFCHCAITSSPHRVCLSVCAMCVHRTMHIAEKSRLSQPPPQLAAQHKQKHEK